jgi:hypothetical protein
LGKSQIVALVDVHGRHDGQTLAIAGVCVNRIGTIRTWLVELFVRGVVPLTPALFKILESLPSVTDKRQLHIIRSRLGNQNFFRQNKTSFGQMVQFEQVAFATGAVCLPKDEYEKWLQMIKPAFSAPTGQLFLKWLQTHKDKVIAKLTAPAEDSPE